MEFDKIKYVNEYSKEHYRQYNFRVSREQDQDIIECIETMQQSGIPINAFIRECIRNAMARDGFVESVLEKQETLKRSRF